ncbi:MAG: AMP-binding protein, partial [Hyphomicrobiales bacterium]|nr:AMP-binding protein [Hyphomicrobiales bacterium]
MDALAREGSSAHDTFPKLLLRNAKIFAERSAMREKDLGIWQSWTWAQVLDEVEALALGLEGIGLTEGKKVAILGANRPRLYWSILACQSLGAIPIPIYADSVAEEIAFILEHAEVNFAIVENQEQVDKILSVSERVPTIERVVYDDERGMRDYDHTRLHSFNWVQQQGREALKSGPDAKTGWLEGIRNTDPHNIAVMLYTSGTTGQPKGVMLSHENTVVSSKNGNVFDNLDETEDVIAYLPLAWVGDHIFCFGQSMAAGFCLNCPESMETIIEDRREIGPTYFFAPPRVFENLLTLIMVRMEDAGPVKRAMFHYFLGVAKRAGEKILNGESVPVTDRLLYGLGEILVYGPLKNRMGLSRLKVGYTAGEAIGPEIFRFYRSLGLNLKQLYGQTEASVYITMQPDR